MRRPVTGGNLSVGKVGMPDDERPLIRFEQRQHLFLPLVGRPPQLLRDLRVLGRHVVILPGIGGQVVELSLVIKTELLCPHTYLPLPVREDSAVNPACDIAGQQRRE